MQAKRDLSIKIDWRGMWSSIRDHLRLYCYVVPVFLGLSSIYAWSLYDLYKSTIKLAPELNEASSRAVMSLIATLNDKKAISNDGAIYPLLYPDIVTSLKFQSELLPVNIELSDGRKLTYYDYLLNVRKRPWWKRMMDGEHHYELQPIEDFDPPTAQLIACGVITAYVNCTVDPKTYIISITVLDQDPLVSTQIADSSASYLQQYITEYRVSKAKSDYSYIKKLQQQAKVKYDAARKAYSDFADSNRDLKNESLKSRAIFLQEEMQRKYEAYSKLNSELISAGAKIQETTPAFTTLQSATVPLESAEPNRILILMIAAAIAFILTTIYILYKEGDLYRLIVGGYKDNNNKR